MSQRQRAQSATQRLGISPSIGRLLSDTTLSSRPLRTIIIRIYCVWVIEKVGNLFVRRMIRQPHGQQLLFLHAPLIEAVIISLLMKQQWLLVQFLLYFPGRGGLALGVDKTPPIFSFSTRHSIEWSLWCVSAGLQLPSISRGVYKLQSACLKKKITAIDYIVCCSTINAFFFYILDNYSHSWARVCAIRSTCIIGSSNQAHSSVISGVRSGAGAAGELEHLALKPANWP